MASQDSHVSAARKRTSRSPEQLKASLRLTVPISTAAGPCSARSEDRSNKSKPSPDSSRSGACGHALPSFCTLGRRSLPFRCHCSCVQPNSPPRPHLSTLENFHRSPSTFAAPWLNLVSACAHPWRGASSIHPLIR